MGDPPRLIEPGRLYETTTRTMHSRFLLRPSDEVNTIIRGVIGRAVRKYDMTICYFVAMSNHLHTLVRPRDAQQLARFMNYVDANIAKEMGRVHGWKQRFWGRRYKPIGFTDEEEAQVAGLRYLLAHGCKEGLVRKPSEWPGASGLQAILTEKPVVGHWFDRTSEYYARRSGKCPGAWEFASEESFQLAPLPCWEHLPADEVRARVTSLVKGIEKETRARLEAEGRSPVGAKRVMRQHPHDQPAKTKKSPAPLVHAASLEAWIQFKEAWLDFRYRYRIAASRLKQGLTASFPPGCFPPRGAFVAANAARPG